MSRYFFKILVWFVNRNWIWEESRRWTERYDDPDPRFTHMGYWGLVVHVHHKDDDPKLGIQIDCDRYISRYRCFKILLQHKDKVTTNP